MSRRLINRVGGDIQVASQTLGPSSNSVTYQQPAFPLDDRAIQKLGDLSRTRETQVYQKQIKDVTGNLGSAVSDLHERLRAQLGRLEKIRSTREERGQEKNADEERLEEHIESLQEEVDALTARSEISVRDAIDRRAALEDESGILGQLYTTASTNRRNGAQENEEEQDEQPPVDSTLQTFREQRKRKAEEHETMSHYQRYALNNDYVGFKKMWHDGQAGDDGPPLPDATKWFRNDGTPVMTLAGRAGGGADAEDSDDDVAVAREVRSLTCPLSLKPFEEPYTSTKCNHTFEKAAIVEYLKESNQEKQCPQAGCDQKFAWKRFKDEFQLDQLILRKLQRAKEAQANHDMEAESDEDTDGRSIAMTGQRTRPGRSMKKERG